MVGSWVRIHRIFWTLSSAGGSVPCNAAVCASGPEEDFNFHALAPGPGTRDAIVVQYCNMGYLSVCEAIERCRMCGDARGDRRRVLVTS